MISATPESKCKKIAGYDHGSRTVVMQMEAVHATEHYTPGCSTSYLQQPVPAVVQKAERG